MIIQPILDLVAICAKKGIENAILSPGSRCAPLTLAFVRHPDIHSRTISDERSAAFIALGMAQQLGQPVVLVCTSGSAALNYYPAIAEAYFQQVPLLILTADRPPEWIDQWDGQTIYQEEVFGKHVKKSYRFPDSFSNEDQVWHSGRIVNEAINLSRQFPAGPVHINIPLREPFYPVDGEKFEFPEHPMEFTTVSSQSQLTEESLRHIKNRLSEVKRLLIVPGQQKPNSQIQSLLGQLAKNQNLLNGRKIVTDAGYTDLTGIFIQALDDLETRREQLLAEESEKTLRVALETMRTDISLAALYDQRDYLTTLIAYSDSTIKLRDRKLAEAEAEIRRLEREAESLAAGVLNHPDQRSLKTAYDRLMLISTRYEGSPLEDKIAATKNVMDRYGRFLGIVADINRNARTLQDEESAKALLADLTRLENENKEWLGEPQRRMLTQARERITTQLETKRQEAVDWFSQMQSKIKVNSNPVRLLEELQQPPAFLSVYEEQQRQSFLKQVERRIDEDELARIEQQFRRIRDPELRQACIARLQAIMREGQRVGVAQGGH